MAAPVFKNPVIRWIDHRLPIFSYLHHEAYEYPTPKNLSYWWNFGSLAGFMLAVMIWAPSRNARMPPNVHQ